jgi:spore photoproduct lyase
VWVDKDLLFTRLPKGGRVFLFELSHESSNNPERCRAKSRLSRRIMPMQSMFSPTEIYIDKAVKDHKITKRILDNLPDLPITFIDDPQEIKIPEKHTEAKKKLLISPLKGEMLKVCQGQGDVCCQYHTIDLITNCHLECSYCILQDYLQNNPIITIHPNVDEICDTIRKKTCENPGKKIRIGAGELSDSLALDHITNFTTECVALANELKDIVFEFKTKTTNIDNLLKLKHQGNVVVAWSVNPQSYIDIEELKCAPLADRLQAARKCADKGYPIAFHFDPLLYYPDWQEQYDDVIQQISALFKPEEIAWVSLGSLRFTPGLKKISMDRFPKSKIMTGEIVPMTDGKMRYFRPIREEMYTHLIAQLTKNIGKIPHYLCMETPLVWQRLFGHIPTLDEVEARVATRFNS